jgi:hypothetical protein
VGDLWGRFAVPAILGSVSDEPEIAVAPPATETLMGRTRAAPVPPVAPNELQEMWVSLMRGSWSSIAVVPTDPGTSVKPVIDALVEAARQHDLGKFTIIDATGASVADRMRLADDLANVVAAGTRAIVAVDSLMTSLGGAHLVKDADVVLLVVHMSSSSFHSVQSTIEMIGHGRIVGSVGLPPAEQGPPTVPPRPAPVEPEAGLDVGPEILEAGGHRLVLNGAGVCRDSRGRRVYTGALYLPSPSTDDAAIVTADEPKAVRMVFSRSVQQDQVIAAFRKGFEDNSGALLPDLAPKLDLLRPCIPAEMADGSVLSIVYLPEKGTCVGVENGRTASVEGRDFAEAMFRCWLGNRPADAHVKDGMLGTRPP